MRRRVTVRKLMATYPALMHPVVVRELLQDAFDSGEWARLEGCLAWAECFRLAAFRNVVRTLNAGVWAYVDAKMTIALMAAVGALLHLAKLKWSPWRSQERVDFICGERDAG